jgi:RHH-type transcriptional regulator, rel operon repressor / antitoxin RelB
MLTIRLPRDLEKRLTKIALQSGQTKTDIAREAIVEYIYDLEDYFLAEARAAKNEKTIPLMEVDRLLGFR